MAYNKAIDEVLSILENDQDSDIQIKQLRKMLTDLPCKASKASKAVTDALNIMESDGDGDIKLKKVRNLNQ